MPYSAQITRSAPSCIIFMIDRSGSMSEPLAGTDSKRKANTVADAVNRLLSDLTVKCAKGEGVRYYFDIGVVGYGSNNEGVAMVGGAFAGALTGRELVPVPEVYDNPARVDERKVKVDDGAGGFVEGNRKMPLWFDPVAEGNTPM